MRGDELAGKVEERDRERGRETAREARYWLGGGGQGGTSWPTLGNEREAHGSCVGDTPKIKAFFHLEPPHSSLHQTTATTTQHNKRSLPSTRAVPSPCLAEARRGKPFLPTLKLAVHLSLAPCLPPFFFLSASHSANPISLLTDT